MSSVFLYFVICLLSLFSGFESVHVLEGRLPDALAGLPLPARTQVAVSCIYRDNDVDFPAGVALDTPLSPEAFMAQMGQGLRQGGWEQVRIPPPSIESLVFVSTDLPTPATELAATPFFTKRGLTLTLEYPKARPGLPTRAFFRAERGGVPPEALPPSEPEGLLNDLLPLLTAPKGAELRSRFAVIGGDYISGRANVTTRLSPNRLAEHFASQLEAGGWRVTELRSTKRSALAVLERSEEKQTYDVQLKVFRSVGNPYSEVALEVLPRPND